MDEREVWYGIQYSKSGEDEWYPTQSTAATIESARNNLAAYVKKMAECNMKIGYGYEFRIVRVTTTKEAVE